ncbi:MAG TPA: HEPN domain-containing protein [Bacteroidales bacterium]|jgi:uncharacterized protein (UPF0332 family)|nr:HEPN domain-containing protein [Bacteroidales bacterium]OQB59633.1 MAG: HEPN domain protein [Bacteroidetes bacterium ADurb.Bin145]HPM02553.1 HEPN domain-containing protein [Candidatus Cloacimonadota bacterium]HOU03284.1 HEPN domain-containing protein [Bacteroidales bacterium]HQG63003.1 HEPN domain-containing protein [Bacteroidales bacterium]
MNKPLKEDYIQYRINLARETLQAAKLLAEKGHWISVMNRLYYVCFYAISALLYKDNLNVTTHSGAKRQFSKHYITTGKIDKSLGKTYAKIFDLRHKGDYGDFFDPDREQTMGFFGPVEELVQEIESLLNK